MTLKTAVVDNTNHFILNDEISAADNNVSLMVVALKRDENRNNTWQYFNVFAETGILEPMELSSV